MIPRFVYRFFLITALLSFFCLVNQGFAQNVGDVIYTYGFEQGADADGVPTGCHVDDYAQGAQFVLDNSVTHSGSAAGLIKGPDDSAVLSLDAYLPMIDAVQKDAIYSYSVWLKTEVDSGEYAVQVAPQWDYDGHEPATTDWTEYTGEFTANGDGQAQIVIGLYGKGKIWVDDLEIKLVQGVYAIGDTVYNNSFEAGNDTAGVPVGSYTIYDWSGTGTTATADNNTAHTGDYSIEIYHPESDTNLITGSIDYLIGGVEQQAEYELTVWIKTELTQGDAQVITAWDNARLINSITGSTDWKQYSLTFTGQKGDNLIRLHVQGGKGKAWFDDLVIVKTKEGFKMPTDVVYNPGFELPNDDGTAPAGWSTEPWGSGSVEIGAPGNDTARYIWDNTVYHSGNYSAKIQVTPADVEAGSMDAGWNTKNLEFVAGGLYEMSYWAKTANMASTNYFRLNIGYNNANLTMIRNDTDWVQIIDTLYFPTDQEDNGWRNQMRFRLSGAVSADTLAEAWVDDVNFKFLGVQAPQIDSVAAVAGDNNSVSLSWHAAADVASPVYHILMQPVSDNGVYDNNLLTNPGFENPNDDGSAPEGWEFTYDEDYAPAYGEWPASENYDGNFGVYVGEQDTNNAGVYARWDQVYSASNMSRSNAYLYGAMVKYNNVTVAQDPVEDERSPLGQYYTAGVNILYDRYDWTFQNAPLIETGWSTPIGTSDGWEQISLPLIYDQAATRHHISIGIGAPSGAVAKGNAYVDNAFVVPFDEIGTTSETSFTVDNVPAGVKYFAVYVEDASGEKLGSPARIATISQPTAVRDNVQPLTFKLEQNYPNPFNPTTRIEYTIPQQSNVRLIVYDILGRKVMTLVNRKSQLPGSYFVDFNASKLASGVYFYSIITKNHITTKKMMLLK